MSGFLATPLNGDRRGVPRNVLLASQCLEKRGHVGHRAAINGETETTILAEREAEIPLFDLT